MKHCIKLPDGSVITSGPTEEAAIQSLRLTECVNAGQELTLGSVCSAMLEVTLLVTGTLPVIETGMEIVLYREEEEQKQLGVFRLEAPIITGGARVKLVGYDRVTALDQNADGWLQEAGRFPCTLRQLAKEVCQSCGLTLAETEIPNGGLLVQSAPAKEATFRRVMEWIGEAAGCFCHATAAGEICLEGYRDKGVVLHEKQTLGLGLRLDAVTPVETVEFAEVSGGKNAYVLSGNPLLQGAARSAADTILKGIPQGYTPGKVTVPANTAIQAGDRLTVVDAKGRPHSFLVMTKTTEKGLAVLECTGSHRRDSAVAIHDPSPLEKRRAWEKAASAAAGAAVQMSLPESANSGSETEPFVLLGKTVFWQSNADGTYTLMGK